MKKILLSVLLVLGGTLSVMVWTDSRTTALYARQDLLAAKKTQRAAQNPSPKPAGEADPALQQREGEFARLEATLDRMTACAIAGAVLSLASLFLIWKPEGANLALTGEEDSSAQRAPHLTS
jgi:hypothetical protein